MNFKTLYKYLVESDMPKGDMGRYGAAAKASDDRWVQAYKDVANNAPFKWVFFNSLNSGDIKTKYCGKTKSGKQRKGCTLPTDKSDKLQYEKQEAYIVFNHTLEFYNKHAPLLLNGIGNLFKRSGFKTVKTEHINNSEFNSNAKKYPRNGSGYTLEGQKIEYEAIISANIFTKDIMTNNLLFPLQKFNYEKELSKVMKKYISMNVELNGDNYINTINGRPQKFNSIAELKSIIKNIKKDIADLKLPKKELENYIKQHPKFQLQIKIKLRL